MKTSFIFILSLVFSSCTYDNVSTVLEDLPGRWVDINTKTDTLTFRLIGGHDYMILGRGRESRSGSFVPKPGSGPYEYSLLQEDTIHLRWSLSSNSAFNAYYFKQTGDKLIIGSFFDEHTSGTNLIFRKLSE